MSLLQIAWRNFRYRSVSSILTTLSLALGVALVVLVLAVYGIITDAFRGNSSVSYNLVIGPKGDPLQLTLNSVYYLSQPIQNLPFTDYMEFHSAEERAEMVRRYGGSESLGQVDGKYARYVGGGLAIPLALGDYIDQYRVVGTTTDFFDKLLHGPEVDQPFTFRQGRNFEAHNAENGYFEAVLGSRVASTLNLGVGDEFFPTHGDPDGKGHRDAFQIVGVLAPTGTPSDRAAFVNLEGFYLMENHAKPVDQYPDDMVQGSAPMGIDPDGNEIRPLTIPEREVTSILVRTGGLWGAQLMNLINEGKDAQAAAPVGVIHKLLTEIVGPLRTALIIVTVITCVVAAMSILVGIYNSMNDRRRDIAVMRALGARRDAVTSIILLESLLIAIIGSIAGWVLAHAAILIASPMIESYTGVWPGFFRVSQFEFLVLPLVLLLATLAGLLPATIAYRTDVSRNLAA
ncbi:MAG: FtsX-like permease family protein [Planctomycetaceae bacterium]|nr:MAG: FtsX-like permease family protein [Planctomycetaceae bacterium]